MSKRANSKGSVYQRAADGRWVAALKNLDGRRLVHYEETEDDARHWLEVARDKRDRGALSRPGRQTVEQYLTAWLRDRVKPTVRPATYRSYLGLMTHHVLPRVGRMPLQQLGTQHVQQLLNAVVSGGNSPRTAGHVRAVLRTALNQAIADGTLERNAASATKPPRIEQEFEHQAFTRDELRRFLDAIASDRLRALYLIAVSTGLRQGEVLGLTWDAVDLDAGFLRVHRQLQRVDGKLELVDVKSRSSRRTVMLTPDAVAALREHAARQRLEKMAHRKRWHDTGLAFTTPIGTGLEGTNVTKAFQRILRNAGIAARRFHDLRHSAASLLLLQGVSYKVVASVLGHSSTKLTLDTYSHVVPELQRDAAEKMQAALHR